MPQNSRHQPLPAPVQRSNRPVYAPSLVWLQYGILLGLTAGCDRTGDVLTEAASGSGKVQLVSTSVSPRATIDQCVGVYQRMQSYRDKAFVRLRYTMDGKLLEDRAPLAIAWSADGRVGIRAYSVQAGPDKNRWRLKFREDQSLVPHQVLSRAVPKQLNFEWLLSDPLVAERLRAGLAGFPPQLDLLLADRPLSGLINDSATLTYLAPQSIDGRVCVRILIQRGPAEFVLWIDQTSLLLRRMQMPKSHLTEPMLADKRVSDIELTIEFADAQLDAEIDWGEYAVELVPEDVLVSRFVPRPPAVDTTRLGEQIPGFQLQAPNGESIYNSGDRRQRKATVLLWLADHPTCRVAAEQMQRVAADVDKMGLAPDAVEFVSVWAEPQAAEGSTFETLAKDWAMPGKLALDRAAMGRDLFGVLEAPTFVVVDANNRLQIFESRSNPLLDQVLPGLLARIVNGEDLAREVVTRQAQVEERYEAELQMAAAADAPKAGEFPSPRAYEPQTFQLRELDRDPLPTQVLGVGQDEEQALWVLLSNGDLLRRPASPSLAETKHATGWEIDRTAAQRLEIAPSTQLVALGAVDGNRVQLLNTATKQSRTVDLGADARVVDLKWFTLGDPSDARLAVISRDGQTVLIDPSNREQLSGRSPREPVALLSLQGTSPAMDAHVVLADGTLEGLQLSPDSVSALRTHRAEKIMGVTTQPITNSRVTRLNQLAFQPASGPWSTWGNGDQELTLARGWLAVDEPALYLLDRTLQQRWHYRMPLQGHAAGAAVSVAQDPQSGQAIWVVSGQDNSVHVLRADGLIIDHFRPSETVVGLALAAAGERLELILVHPEQAVRYAVDWR